ncbi:hypothetical protein BDB00DRAFT_875826 [Zychaea mexicana]|uniref:uncharacterized protein n=1 Tax=Zychaea mexicana TaxID=64656 RepID=UPI0022FE9626|nr:uncharacterized protein BDB00DRAFT_875826 [Zychaea mexicana]KAI9489988.1 hypothetical protein BDB00DRAFT_875826 [Zychaea mexicana]
MADNTKATGKQPSSRLLGMKFMQRSLEKEKQEELERERKRIITESEWVLEYESDEVQKPKIRVDYQPSYLAFTEPVSQGRQSFKEFNKKTEAIEEETARRKDQEHQKNLDKASELEENETLNEMQKRLQDQMKKDKNKRPMLTRKFDNDDNKRHKQASSSSRPPEQGFHRERGFLKPE